MYEADGGWDGQRFISCQLTAAFARVCEARRSYRPAASGGGNKQVGPGHGQLAA